MATNNSGRNGASVQRLRPAAFRRSGVGGQAFRRSAVTVQQQCPAGTECQEYDCPLSHDTMSATGYDAEGEPCDTSSDCTPAECAMLDAAYNRLTTPAVTVQDPIPTPAMPAKCDQLTTPNGDTVQVLDRNHDTGTVTVQWSSGMTGDLLEARCMPVAPVQASRFAVVRSASSNNRSVRPSGIRM